jgi:hypothetical protein
MEKVISEEEEDAQESIYQDVDSIQDKEPAS